MAMYLRDIRVGSSKTYHLSANASYKTIYFSSTNRTDGLELKGAKFVNNQIVCRIHGKPLSDYEIALFIEKSLR